MSAWTAQTEERLASSQSSSSSPSDEEAVKAELELVASLKAEAQIQGGILDRAKGATIALEAILKDRLGRRGALVMVMVMMVMMMMVMMMMMVKMMMVEQSHSG